MVEIECDRVYILERRSDVLIRFDVRTEIDKLWNESLPEVRLVCGLTSWC